PRRVRPVGPRQPAEGAAERQPVRRAPAGARGGVDLMAVTTALELLQEEVRAASVVVPVGAGTHREVGNPAVTGGLAAGSAAAAGSDAAAGGGEAVVA